MFIRYILWKRCQIPPNTLQNLKIAAKLRPEPRRQQQVILYDIFSLADHYLVRSLSMSDVTVMCYCSLFEVLTLTLAEHN